MFRSRLDSTLEVLEGDWRFQYFLHGFLKAIVGVVFRKRFTKHIVQVVWNSFKFWGTEKLLRLIFVGHPVVLFDSARILLMVNIKLLGQGPVNLHWVRLKKFRTIPDFINGLLVAIKHGIEQFLVFSRDTPLLVLLAISTQDTVLETAALERKTPLDCFQVLTDKLGPLTGSKDTPICDFEIIDNKVVKGYDNCFGIVWTVQALKLRTKAVKEQQKRHTSI